MSTWGLGPTSEASTLPSPHQPAAPPLSRFARIELSTQANRLGPADRRDVIQRLEDFLSSELHTYVCQICYEASGFIKADPPPHVFAFVTD